jgi:transposase
MSWYEMTKFEWWATQPLLPNKPCGVLRVDDRLVLNGIFWILRSGSLWRDLPERYGPRTTCYNRFPRWTKAGVWDRIMEAINDAYGGDVRIIDGTSVRVHHSTATLKKSHPDRCLGRSRGGLTTKIHALTDNDGLPVKLVITPGQTHDIQAAAEHLKDIRKGQMLLADRAYYADWLREMVFEKHGWANIPPKTNRKAPICFSP